MSIPGPSAAFAADVAETYAQRLATLRLPPSAAIEKTPRVEPLTWNVEVGVKLTKEHEGRTACVHLGSRGTAHVWDVGTTNAYRSTRNPDPEITVNEDGMTMIVHAWSSEPVDKSAARVEERRDSIRRHNTVLDEQEKDARTLLSRKFADVEALFRSIASDSIKSAAFRDAAQDRERIEALKAVLVDDVAPLGTVYSILELQDRGHVESLPVWPSDRRFKGLGTCKLDIPRITSEGSDTSLPAIELELEVGVQLDLITPGGEVSARAFGRGRIELRDRDNQRGFATSWTPPGHRLGGSQEMWTTRANNGRQVTDDDLQGATVRFKTLLRARRHVLLSHLDVKNTEVKALLSQVARSPSEHPAYAWAAVYAPMRSNLSLIVKLDDGPLRWLPSILGLEKDRTTAACYHFPSDQRFDPKAELVSDDVTGVLPNLDPRGGSTDGATGGRADLWVGEIPDTLSLFGPASNASADESLRFKVRVRHAAVESANKLPSVPAAEALRPLKTMRKLEAFDPAWPSRDGHRDLATCALSRSTGAASAWESAKQAINNELRSKIIDLKTFDARLGESPEVLKALRRSLSESSTLDSVRDLLEKDTGPIVHIYKLVGLPYFGDGSGTLEFPSDGRFAPSSLLGP